MKTFETDNLAPIGRARRGFTFAEVMFAVVILGIGFIMIAAIFPVAIQQNAQTSSDSISTALVQQAVATLQQPGLGQILPYNYVARGPAAKAGVFYSPFGQYTTNTTPNYSSFGNVDVTNDTFGNDIRNLRPWRALAGKLISGSDPRFGWTFAYRYTSNTSIEAVIFMAQAPAQRGTFRTQNNGTGVSDATDDLAATAGGQTPATFMLKKISARFVTYNGTQPDRAYFSTTSADQKGQVGCLAEGAYVLVADGDPGNTFNYSMPTNSNPHAAGALFRLGAQITDPANSGYVVFELVNGQDVTSVGSDSGRPPYSVNVLAGGKSDVLVLGRATAYPGTDIGSPYKGTGPKNDFAGQAMDIAVYRTTIGLR